MRVSVLSCMGLIARIGVGAQNNSILGITVWSGARVVGRCMMRVGTVWWCPPCGVRAKARCMGLTAPVRV